jgi:HK97 family phage major capsid protein
MADGRCDLERWGQIIATDVTARADQTTPNFEKVTPPGCGLSAVAPLTTWAIEDAIGTSGYDPTNFVLESIGKAFAVTEGALFITGTGTNQPKGLLSGAAPVTTADGARAWGTLQYTKSGAAATIGTNLDAILACLYSMKPAYRAKASFLMNPSTLQTIRQMKDSQLRYLWEPSAQAGEPSRLAGVAI